MPDSVRPHRRQPTRLPRPWDSPGKNTGVGCHFLLQCMKVKSEREVAQSCPTLSDPMDRSLPGSSVHGIFQARVLEWGAIAFSNLYLKALSFYYQFCPHSPQWVISIHSSFCRGWQVSFTAFCCSDSYSHTINGFIFLKSLLLADILKLAKVSATCNLDACWQHCKSNRHSL